MIRIAAIGSASAGKSAVLNAVFGTKFPVDAKGGSTATKQSARTVRHQHDLEVIDLPPGDVVDADVYLLICDKDLADSDAQQARRIAAAGRLLGIVLNKSDTYKSSELHQLIRSIRARLHDIVPPQRVVACAAEPIRVVYRDGIEQHARAAADVRILQMMVDELLDAAAATTRVQIRELKEQTERSARVAAGKLKTLWKELADKRQDPARGKTRP